MLSVDKPGPDTAASRYARCIEASRRVRWDIERDVIRGRQFDPAHWFLPDGLCRAGRLSFLSPADRRRVSQVQGRTYANMFGLVERFIGAKILEVSRDYWFGDQVALEALVRFTDEELKHQALFRRLEAMMAEGMAPGYAFDHEPNDVARAVLGASTWAVLALTCHIELFTQAHYRQSIGPEPDLSPLFKDVFLFHWREESQHAILDELEWRREDARLSEAARDAAVGEFIGLVGAVDGILRAQARADTRYLLATMQGPVATADRERLEREMLAAYRWQYIGSGVREPRLTAILTELTTPEQGRRIAGALAPYLD